jgi:hypothetical protein
MHGLRCDPALLGWTRLLDEWVVGLIRGPRDAASDPVCWGDPAETVGTLADAATRVRAFAYRENGTEPSRLRPDGVLQVELQGQSYCAAVDQRWPSSAEEAIASAPSWLESALRRARTAAGTGEVAVAAVFATPRCKPASLRPDRAELAEAFIAASRVIRCSGCAFSFPHGRQLAKYRHGSAEYPGALLLVQADG